MTHHALTIARLVGICCVVFTLAGCLAVNTVLGVGSLFAPGPLQFAGTFYSLANYTFQYAVHRKSPLEVVEEDFRQLDDFLDPYAPVAKGTMSSPGLTLAWQGQEHIRLRPLGRTPPAYHFDNPVGLPAWSSQKRWQRIMNRKHARQRLMALHFRSGIRSMPLPDAQKMLAQR